MREIQYKNFSLKTHKRNYEIGTPSVCQFALTFKCDLHCKHCYSDCYNNPHHIKKELNTKEVKTILDKIHRSGVIWLCFTGGDPITRQDFLDIYSYAKNKGFIITIFTNGYSMTEDTADYLEKKPPFFIEITLNAVTPKTSREISGIGDSLERVLAGIGRIIKRGLSLNVKIQVTKQSLEELGRIKEFVKGIGLKARSTPVVHARLDGDTAPCNLRISPEQVLDIGDKSDPRDGGGCLEYRKGPAGERLFRCAIGTSDNFYVDPYGNMTPCSILRRPAVNLLKNSIEKAQGKLLSEIRSMKFKTDSKCRHCEIRELCSLCPGWAFLETGSMESPVDYFCALARLKENRINEKISARIQFTGNKTV